ncbi:MAG: helix-turn-helix transcriptional regulator [Candidatus Moranbacteria bacterium]|jgi:transcriptional regulator with XRE-family HTH domain|nr:helix-turn-helix transcriptional regulator [Candidatus Moranbacteria bacterium]
MANSKISSNIKKLRTKKGYSLEKVARLADLSLNTVMRVESGVNKNPTIETLTKIAKVFGIGIDDLIK